MSSEAVDRVEVVVDRISLTSGDERFIEWVEGWLRARYVVDAYLRDNRTEVAFILRKDMFRLFEKMYRVVGYMRWKLGVEAPVVMCSGGECIDMSDVDYYVLMSNYKIKKLVKAKNIVKQFVKNDYVTEVSMKPWFGYAILNIGCYGVLLYTDEIIAMAGLLLDELHRITDLKVLRDARDYVYSVVRPIDVDLGVLGFEVEDGVGASVNVRLDGCKRGFTYEEVLKLVYKLLITAVNDLKDVKELAKRDYGVE